MLARIGFTDFQAPQTLGEGQNSIGRYPTILVKERE
jgi:hypothetical protein